MVKDKSSSKQANVTLPILNSSAVLTAPTTSYENPCLTTQLKILTVSIAALYILLSLYLYSMLVE